MLYKALVEVEEEMLDMVVLHLVEMVVPELSSSLILHKYLKNYNVCHRRELYNTT
jgi:hypothetical protein